MELFKIDPGLVIWTWIIFGLLFLILSKFAIPSVLKGISEREKVISSAIDNAREIENKLASIEIEKSAIIIESKKIADEIVRKAREEAEIVRQKIITQANEEALEISNLAKLKIASERSAMLEQLKEDISIVICDTAEHLTAKSFTGNLERDYTENIVTKL